MLAAAWSMIAPNCMPIGRNLDKHILDHHHLDEPQCVVLSEASHRIARLHDFVYMKFWNRQTHLKTVRPVLAFGEPGGGLNRKGACRYPLGWWGHSVSP